jgi:hypothetical protein
VALRSRRQACAGIGMANTSAASNATRLDTTAEFVAIEMPVSRKVAVRAHTIKPLSKPTKQG